MIVNMNKLSTAVSFSFTSTCFKFTELDTCGGFVNFSKQNDLWRSYSVNHTHINEDLEDDDF